MDSLRKELAVVGCEKVASYRKTLYLCNRDTESVTLN